MPDKTCLTCGGLTNTAVCDYVEHSDWRPRKCYAKWSPDHGWQKGCAYDRADLHVKGFVDKVILQSRKQ